MDRFARVVLGYHGTSKKFATELLDGTRSVADWTASTNSWDWLGKGIYFWEHAPARAMRWAEKNLAGKPGKYGADPEPAVIGAVIQLNPCFDLMDVRYTSLLSERYQQLVADYAAVDKPLPENTGGRDSPRRVLDCLVINAVLDGEQQFKTVRGAFWEGEAAYPGGLVYSESHMQIAVRDPTCILGVFRPNL